MNTLTTLGDLLLLACLPAALAAPAMFSRVPWWKSTWGRHLMIHMIAVAWVLALAALRLVIGDSTFFAGLRAASYFALCIALWQRAVLFRRDLTPDEGRDQ